VAVGNDLCSQEPVERADDRTPFAGGDDDAVEIGKHGWDLLGGRPGPR
jgi:hypothetical protein